MIVGDLLYRLYFRYVYTYTNYALMYIGVYRPKMDQNGIVSEAASLQAGMTEFWASVPGFAVLSTSACQLEHCGARWIWCAWEPKARSRRGVLVTGTWWLLLYSIWFIHVTLCLHKKSEIAFFMPQITCSVHRSWILPIFVVRVQWLTSTCNTNWAGGCTLNSNFQPSNSRCSMGKPWTVNHWA